MTLADEEAARSPLHRRLVFLLGSPRSGADVVRDALKSFPGVAALPEPTHLFDEVLLRIWASSKVEGTDGIGRLVDEDELLPALRRLADAILVSAVPPGQQLVEHTPDHAMVIGVIQAVYPDASYVAITRDGRPATEELVHGPHRQHRWAIVPARQWADAQRAISAPPMTCRLRLESLLADPERELSTLATALGLAATADDVVRAAATVHAARDRYPPGAGAAATAAVEAVGADQLAELGYGRAHRGAAARALRALWRATLPRGAR